MIKVPLYTLLLLLVIESWGASSVQVDPPNPPLSIEAEASCENVTDTVYIERSAGSDDAGFYVKTTWIQIGLLVVLIAYGLPVWF